MNQSKWMLYLAVLAVLISTQSQFADAQDNNMETAIDNVQYVAEIRMFEFPVEMNGGDKPRCEVIDQLLRSTDVRDVEILCPSQTGDQRTPPASGMAGLPENLRHLPISPTNDRRSSVVVVTMNAEAVWALIESARGGGNSLMTQAPTVSMNAGQSAEIQMGSQRPFVTGYKQVTGDFATGWQPVISLILDGKRTRISARPDGGNIVVATTIEDWKIKSVEECTMSGPDGEVTLQIPVVDVDSVHAEASIASGNSFLLIPARHPTAAVLSKGTPMNSTMRLFRKTVEAPTPVRTAVLITVRNITDDALKISAVPERSSPNRELQHRSTTFR